MNQQNAKDYLPLVQALHDCELQWWNENAQKWQDVTEAGFSYPVVQYRRRPPAPRMVPLEAKDVPPGSWLRNHDGFPYWLILSVFKTGFKTIEGSYEWLVVFHDKDYEISHDGGKTWNRCEKPEGT